MYSGKILNWCLFKPEQLEKILKTNLQKGLSSKEARRRDISVEKSGKSVRELFYPFKVFFVSLFKVLCDFSVLLLFVSSLVCIHGSANGVGAFAAVSIFVLICALLKALTLIKAAGEGNGTRDDEYTVLRDGKQKKVKGAALVPGDVIIIRKGDIVPEDIRLVSTSSLSVIEKYDSKRVMPTTKDAEYYPVSPKGKIPLRFKKNMLFKGSAVVGGEGRGVVLDMSLDFDDICECLGYTRDVRKVFEYENKAESTDIYTRITGKNALGTEKSKNGYSSDSSIRGEAERVMTIARICGLFVGTLVLVIAIASKMLISDAFLLSVAVMGCAPTILCELCGNLAFLACRAKLGQQGIYIHDFESAEKLAMSKSIILCGSTGYKIEKMSVHAIFFGERCTEMSQRLPKSAKIFFEMLLCASDLEFKVDKNGKRVIAGDIEGMAALEGARAFGGISRGSEAEYISENERYYDTGGAFVGSLVHIDGESSLFITRGTSSHVLSKCKSYLSESGEILPLTDEIAEKTSKCARDYEKCDNYKVIAVYGRKMPENIQPVRQGLDERDGIFIGFVVMSIRLGTEGGDFVNIMRRNGIKPIIFSNEASDTVISNLKRLGILQKGDNYITARTYKSLDEKLFEEDFDTYTLFMNMDSAEKREILIKKKRTEGVLTVAADKVTDAFDMSEADVLISFGKDAPRTLRRISDIHSDTEHGARTVCKMIRICRNTVRATSLALGYLFSAQCSAMVFALLGILSAIPSGGVFPMTLPQLLSAVFVCDIVITMLTAFARTPKSIINDTPKEFYNYYRLSGILPKALISGALAAACSFIMYLIALLVLRDYQSSCAVAVITLYSSKALCSLFCIMKESTAKAPAPTPVPAIIAEVLLGMVMCVIFGRPLFTSLFGAVMLPLSVLFSTIPMIVTKIVFGLDGKGKNKKRKTR